MGETIFKFPTHPLSDDRKSAIANPLYFSPISTLFPLVQVVAGDVQGVEGVQESTGELGDMLYLYTSYI